MAIEGRDSVNENESHDMKRKKFKKILAVIIILIVIGASVGLLIKRSIDFRLQGENFVYYHAKIHYNGTEPLKLYLPILTGNPDLEETFAREIEMIECEGQIVETEYGKALEILGGSYCEINLNWTSSYWDIREAYCPGDFHLSLTDEPHYYDAGCGEDYYRNITYHIYSNRDVALTLHSGGYSTGFRHLFRESTDISFNTIFLTTGWQSVNATQHYHSYAS